MPCVGESRSQMRNIFAVVVVALGFVCIDPAQPPSIETTRSMLKKVALTVVSSTLRSITRVGAFCCVYGACCLPARACHRSPAYLRYVQRTRVAVQFDI